MPCAIELASGETMVMVREEYEEVFKLIQVCCESRRPFMELTKGTGLKASVRVDAIVAVYEVPNVVPRGDG